MIPNFLKFVILKMTKFRRKQIVSWQHRQKKFYVFNQHFSMIILNLCHDLHYIMSSSFPLQKQFTHIERK